MTKLHQREVTGAALVILDRNGITGDTIKFQAPPQSITDGKNATYSSKQVLGRSEPLRAYTGSDERSIQFELDYYWYQYGGTGTIGSWEFIRENLNKIKSLVYPQYYGATSTGYMPAQKVLFFFGQLYTGVPCIVKAVNITYEAPWVNPDQGPTQAKGKSRVTTWSSAQSVESGSVVPFHTKASIQLAVSYDYNDARGSEDIKAGADGNYNLLTTLGINLLNYVLRVGRG